MASLGERLAERLGSLKAGGDEQRIVPCADCKRPTPISEFAWDLGKVLSEHELQRGKPPLGNDELTRCPECGQAWRERTLAASIELSRRMVEWLREAREGAVNAELKFHLRQRRLWDELREIEEAERMYREREKTQPPGGKGPRNRRDK